MHSCFFLSTNCYISCLQHLIFAHEFGVQMAREMDEIMRQQIAQPANSCSTQDGGVSFLDQVILPLYGVIAAVSFCMFYSYFTSFTNM